MQEVGDDADHDEDEAGQVERLDGLADPGAQDVLDGNRRGRGEEVRQRLDRPGDDEQSPDEHVRHPRRDDRHLPGGDVVGRRFDVAAPAVAPPRTSREVPGLLGHEEALARGEHHQGETEEATEQRRELRAEEDRDQDVGHGHGEGRVQSERPDLEAVGKALVLPEEAAQHAGQEQRDERPDSCVQDRDVDRDVVDVGGEGQPEELDPFVHTRAVGETAAEADQHRCADRAEADRGALDDEADHDRGHGGEAERQQQRRHDRGGCPEAGRAFDEAAEQPPDDDRLDPTVGADVGEAGADGRHRAALGQRLQQQQGAEDDVEQRPGDDEPLDAGGGDRCGRHLPDEQCDEHHDDEADGHGELRRPAEADQQDADHGDG